MAVNPPSLAIVSSKTSLSKMFFMKTGGSVICVCERASSTSQIMASLPPTPHKKNSKNPALLKHMRPFKGLKAQTIRLIGAKRSQSAAPEEKELFNNVYNSNPKAAELHQMLRWDGARRNPPGKMRSGTRSGFSTLTATKNGGVGGCEGNKDSDIPVGPKLDTRTSSGKWTSPRRSSESQRTGVVSVLMTNRTKCFN